MITHYAAGFLFSMDGSAVALINKNRPDWQKGHWNGIGGHVEANETYNMTQRREFLEEAGLDVDNWEPFADLTSEKAYIRFFRAWSPDVLNIKTITDEVVGVHNVSHLPTNLVENLKFLIPLALDRKVASSHFTY